MVSQQHNDVYTASTTMKKTNDESCSVHMHKPDAVDEISGDMATDNDGVLALTTLSDDDLRLEVTCGQNQAVLYTSRLQLGSKGTCVLFENAWLTPNEFQYVSGRETAKDWKRSIKHHGKSLKVLIAKGILSTTPPARCNCSQCITSPKKDAETWKIPGDRTAALPSSVISTKLSGVSDAWKVPATKHNNGHTLDSSAFRPPADVGPTSDAASVTNLHSSHSTEDSTSSSGRCVIKKSQKRSRSPTGIDATSESQGKYLTTSTSCHRFVGSTPSLTAVDNFPRVETAYDASRQQFSTVENCRRVEVSNRACSLMPLSHEYQSSADGSKSLLLSARHDVAGVHKIPTTSAISSIVAPDQISQSRVLSPVAASSYLPFFSTPSNNISGLYYPNPYVMLSAPPLAYQQQTPPHFPRGWIPSIVGGTDSAASKVVAEHMRHLDSQLYHVPPTTAAFDFPWMRGNSMQTTQFLSKASTQMCDLYEGHLAAVNKQSFDFNQSMFMRNASSLGAALVSDGRDMYRQPSYDLLSSFGTNRGLLDNHPPSYLGIYPSLFHSSYLGVPSR